MLAGIEIRSPGAGGAIVTALEPIVVPAVTVSEKVITIFAPIATLVALLAIENVAVGTAARAGATGNNAKSTPAIRTDNLRLKYPPTNFD